MAKKIKKHKGGGRWLQEIQTDDTVEEQEGTFSGDNSAEEIALELKRKAPDFQAAMGKVTFYLNRAGKRLPESRIKELNRVKTLLREMYSRKDRERANKKKKASEKVASPAVKYFDDNGNAHFVDLMVEAIPSKKEVIDGKEKSKHHTISTGKQHIKSTDMERYREWLLQKYKESLPYPDPKTPEERGEDFEVVKKNLMQDFWHGDEVVGFQLSEDDKPEGPVAIPANKVASFHSVVNGKPEIRFSSDVYALQYLADLMKEKIVVANNKVAKRICPKCDKGVGPNGYCLTCKEQTMDNTKTKKKEASEDLIFASAEEAIQHLADLTGKKIQVAE